MAVSVRDTTQRYASTGEDNNDSNWIEAGNIAAAPPAISRPTQRFRDRQRLLSSGVCRTLWVSSRRRASVQGTEFARSSDFLLKASADGFPGHHNRGHRASIVPSGRATSCTDIQLRDRVEGRSNSGRLRAAASLVSSASAHVLAGGLISLPLCSASPISSSSAPWAPARPRSASLWRGCSAYPSTTPIGRSSGAPGSISPSSLRRKASPAFASASAKRSMRSPPAEPLVLATGGGAVLRPENRLHLAQRGCVVYLRPRSAQLSTV